MQSTEEKQLYWAILELFGHSTIAGQVTERNYGSITFLQVEVPETDKQPAYTRLINPQAVYAINPVDEQTARRRAGHLNKTPITEWEIGQAVEKHMKQLQVAVQHEIIEDDEDHY